MLANTIQYATGRLTEIPHNLLMNELTQDEKDRLTALTHDLFVNVEFRDWVNAIPGFERNRWYSVIVELDRVGAPVGRLKTLGRAIYSAYVFRCFESPRAKSTGELKILFCHADEFWNCLVGHRPALDGAQ